MRARSDKFSKNLAVLAICLHMVVATVGGRICLWAAPLPATDACLSLCCDELESSTDGAWITRADHQGSPITPTDKDCCLEMVSSCFTSTLNVNGMRNLGGPFLTLLPSTRPMRITTLRVHAGGPNAAQPPPCTPMIRSTILRI